VSLLWDSKVSRFQIRIFREDGELWVRDVRKDTVGIEKTKVNGLALTHAHARQALKENDEIRLGFIFVSERTNKRHHHQHYTEDKVFLIFCVDLHSV
jgi:pSer/pThr/pTyr-binding forkhead associated (FHA) protein